MLDTWGAMEELVNEGKCKAIGLSDVSLEQVQEIFEAARIKPAVVHVESHPYLPEWELLNYCKENGIVLQAFAALGHSSEPKSAGGSGHHRDRPASQQDSGPSRCSPGRSSAGRPR